MRRIAKMAGILNSVNMETFCIVLIFIVERTFSCSPGSVGFRTYPNMDIQNRNPDVPETHIAASGPFLKALNNSSPELITLNNSLLYGIQFSQSYPRLDKRRLIQPCMESLLRLAKSIYIQWGGRYNLYVIEAFDSRRKPVHAKDSLHYEGRAVDLKLVPSDPNRAQIVQRNETERILLRRLATLGYHQALFSFVQIEKHHVHMSCKRTSDTPLHGQSKVRCFPGQSTVRLETGRKQYIRNLKVGDRVLTRGRDGRPVFSDVIMMMHQQPRDIVHDYIHITTNFSRSITLSRYHLIFMARGCNSKQSAIYAENIQVGDKVLVYENQKDEMLTAQVTATSRTTERGAFAPLTSMGTILVDDVYTSCYAEIRNHNIAHTAFAPYRWFPWMNDLFSVLGQVPAVSEYHWYPELLLNYLDSVRVGFLT